MQSVISIAAILTVMFLSFQFSLLLGRGLLSLMLLSMYRWESRADVGLRTARPTLSTHLAKREQNSPGGSIGAN